VTGQLFSSLWYRVATLKPKLRQHADIQPHDYRGQRFYVVEDHASGRVHRFTPVAHHFLALMDGCRTVDQIWELSENEFGDAAPTQDEAIELLAQLHGADLLRSETPPDCLELFRRYEKKVKQGWRKRLMNPLALSVPLIDPNAFLDRHISSVRWIFSRFGMLVWLVTVVTALVMTVSHWPDLTHNVIDRVLMPTNLLLVLLTYPLIKLVHEFGHAFAAKHFGCEVHEMGIMFLVLMPMPYVDASASSALPERRQRALVAAIGIMVELFIAALALFVWITVEPGLVRAMAFNVMLIGGVSTVLFNGNPLLRFDGYFVLSDTLGIANLAPRSIQYLGYLAQRYLFGLREQSSPAHSRSEAAWLGAYAVAAFCYRMMITFGIIILIAGKFFVLGIMLAIWAAILQIFWPLLRKIRFVATSPQLRLHRIRAVGVTLIMVTAIALLLFQAPFPLRTITDGVVWAPAEAEVRAGASAVVRRLVAVPYSAVSRGDVLLETSDPTLAARTAVLAADLRAAQVRYHVARGEDQVEAGNIRDEILTIEADLALAHERLDELVIRSPADGIFLLDRPEDLVGKFIRQGDLVGFVADLSRGTVRVAVTQADIGLIRSATSNVEIRFADRLATVMPARISRESPAATWKIPSRALGTQGGGLLAVDPSDESGTRTLEKVFHIELTVDAPVERLGGRTFVRFDHGSEPLGWQWYRRLRQLMLRQFNA
jgi:putative peptide zinc metalloprotease protein